jgi:hypothetical protein
VPALRLSVAVWGFVVSALPADAQRRRVRRPSVGTVAAVIVTALEQGETLVEIV